MSSPARHTSKLALTCVFFSGFVCIPWFSLYVFNQTRLQYIQFRANRIHNKMMGTDQEIDPTERDQFYKQSIQDWKLTNQSPETSICRVYDLYEYHRRV